VRRIMEEFFLRPENPRLPQSEPYYQAQVEPVPAPLSEPYSVYFSIDIGK